MVSLEDSPNAVVVGAGVPILRCQLRRRAGDDQEFSNRASMQVCKLKSFRPFTSIKFRSAIEKNNGVAIDLIFLMCIVIDCNGSK